MSNDNSLSNEFAMAWADAYGLKFTRSRSGTISLMSIRGTTKTVEGALGKGPTLRHAITDALARCPEIIDDGDLAAVLLVAAALDADSSVIDTLEELFPAEDEDDENSEDGGNEGSEEEEDDGPVRIVRR